MYTTLSSPYVLHAPPISFFSISITCTIVGKEYRELSYYNRLK
jgi:hypothetical protein